MSKSSNTSAAEKLPLVHPNQAALPGSIPELDSLKAELVAQREENKTLLSANAILADGCAEQGQRNSELNAELANLRVEHARLKDGMKELINCVAWYATSLNWMRRLDAKDNDKPAEAHSVKWKRAQECLELVDKLLKG